MEGLYLVFGKGEGGRGVRTWRRGTIFSAMDSLRALNFAGRLSSIVRTPSLESKRTSSSGRSSGTTGVTVEVGPTPSEDETDMEFSSHVQLVVGLAIARWWWGGIHLWLVGEGGIEDFRTERHCCAGS